MTTGQLTLLLTTLPPAALAAMAFVLKMLLDHAANRDLKKFEADLSKTAFEHQTTFSDMHARRAEVIAELYKKFGVALRNGRILTQPLQVDPARMPEFEKVAIDAFNDASEYFALHRLYLNPTSEDLCEKLLQTMKGAIIDFQQGTGRFGGDRDVKAHVQSWQKFEKEVPEVLRQLATEFRSILRMPDKG